jgi:hypothetical protein
MEEVAVKVDVPAIMMEEAAPQVGIATPLLPKHQDASAVPNTVMSQTCHPPPLCGAVCQRR